MDLTIAAILIQDGITNGAIYALLALALVLVHAVTRVIFVPQGEFVSFGALTLAALQFGQVPGTVWLLVGGGLAAAALDLYAALRARRWHGVPRSVAFYVLYPLAMLYATRWLAPLGLPQFAQLVLMLALVVPLGPIVYRLAYQPLADASVLVLFIVSIAVHFALIGLGLLCFGPEGSRTPPFAALRFDLGAVSISGQSLFVVAASVLLIVALYLFFERTLYGKALRATAVNRAGARLVGMSITLSGRLTFTLAALIGAVSGALIAPMTTIYYDSGFLVGLKGFVAAIIGALASYPLAAVGALVVGLLEAFASFWASAYKEVIVFTLIIPVLLWRSLVTPHVEEEEE
ncbi:MAG: branched-chain amino acid ABC transporter permease [Sulfurifustaceae bacterium]